MTAQEDVLIPRRSPLKYCNFCGKSERDVFKLIAGPDVHICDECVALCQDIIDEQRAESQPDKTSKDQ